MRHREREGSGLPATLIGCAPTFKGTLYFVWPSLASRSMAQVSEEEAWQFQVAGAASVSVGLFIGRIALSPAA